MNPNHKPPQVARIEILLYADGSLSITEESSNKIVTYGMLEQAKFLLAAQQAERVKAAQGGIETVPPALINRLGNHGKNGS